MYRRVIVRFIGISGMPRFQCFSDAEHPLVNYFGVLKINVMIITPSVSCNIRASFKTFNVSDVFLFSS